MTIDRRIAIGDCVLFGLLAVPGLGPMLIDALIMLNEVLGLPGAARVEPLSALLISLVGVLGFGFAWVRVASVDRAFLSIAMGVKAAAFVVFTVAVIGGAPASLMIIACADAVAAVLLYRARRSG